MYRLICVMLLLTQCYIPDIPLSSPQNPNTEFTFSKYQAEEKIMNANIIKTLACNFTMAHAYGFADLGNDQDPNPNERNKTIYYEKRAVRHCIKSILTIPCPTFPTNTTQAVNEMTFNFLSNRKLNCTFDVIKFLDFKKPLSGNI